MPCTRSWCVPNLLRIRAQFIVGMPRTRNIVPHEIAINWVHVPPYPHYCGFVPNLLQAGQLQARGLGASRQAEGLNAPFEPGFLQFSALLSYAIFARPG